MISSAEIDEKAKEFRISAQNVERDYLFSWLLSGIYANNSLKNRLILKGGNALRKGYLANARFSKDLDFSVREQVHPQELHNNIISVLDFVSNSTGIKFYLDRTEVRPKLVIDNRQVYEARILFQGFYKEEEARLKIHMDITEFDRILLPTQNPQLIHPYSDAASCATNIHCHKLEEVLASKLVGLLHRRKAADIFDLAFAIIRNNVFEVERQEVITTFLQKTIYQSQPQAAHKQFQELAIEESRPFWSSIIAPVTSLFGFDEAVANFRDMITILFGLVAAPAFAPAGYGIPRGPNYFPGTYSPRISYYPSNYRNTIISAGESLKMLRLLYHGMWRIVEPYALRYEIRKKDGLGFEYFWAYDSSGGNSGKVGIKRFFSDDIQGIEMTSTSYNPRWPVEL